MTKKESFLQKAKDLYKSKDYEEVIDLLDTTLLEEYADPDLYAAKAISLQALDKRDERDGIVEIILELNPHHPIGIYYQGVQFDERREYQKAIDTYKRVIKIDSKRSYAYNRLGNVFLALNKYEEAIQAYKKAIKIDPQDKHPYSGLGNVYRKLKKFDEAIQSHKEAIEIDSEYATSYNGLGNVYFDMKKYDKAIESYNKSIEINPHRGSSPYNGLGNVYEVRKKYNRAIELYEKAIEIDPKKILPYYNLGEVYSKLKEYPKAIEYFTEYLRHRENDTDTLNARGRIRALKKIIDDLHSNYN